MFLKKKLWSDFTVFFVKQVRVSETGWASNGGPNEKGATKKNARTYNYNLRKKLAKKKGTPLRPKTVVKAYVFALFNENLKPGQLSERNFGLFKADGSISYDIGFSGLSASSASLSKVNKVSNIIKNRNYICICSFFFIFNLCLRGLKKIYRD